MEPTLPACTAAGFPVSLDIAGQYVAIDPTPAAGCVVFAANGSATDSAEYLVVPQLATGAPGTTVRFDLVGDAILPAPLLSSPPSPESVELPPAERFHTFLRLGDQSRWRGLGPQVASPSEALAPSRSPAAGPGPPALGSTRQFMVCARLDCSRFDRVTARVRALKSTVAIYVDTAALAPPIGLDSLAVDSLATLFDSRLHALDTAAFGAESDIDSNSVVLVLMTPVVNRLVSAAKCGSGFIAGFFLGADLDPAYLKDPRSNKGEVFYSFVADTAGCAHSAALVRRFVPVTFIHEFQHMISYNQHVLEGGGDGEVLWLNEGLSHYAEELGGWSYPPGSAEFNDFMRGNLIDAYAYLDATGDHFLAPSAGIGSLAERGAAWLFVRYVVDRYAGGTTVTDWNQLTRRLVVTTATGAENIEAVTGDPFTDIVTRWALANWVSDLPGFTAPDSLTYDKWAFRTTYAALNAQERATFPKPYPLTPTASTGPAVSLAGTLRAGSGVYHRVLQGPNEDGFTLLFSRRFPFNTNAWPIPASIKPRLSVIRIR